MKDVVLDVPLVWCPSSMMMELQYSHPFFHQQISAAQIFLGPKICIEPKVRQKLIETYKLVWSDQVFGNQKIFLTIINFESKIAFNQKIV